MRYGLQGGDPGDDQQLLLEGVDLGGVGGVIDGDGELLALAVPVLASW